MRLKPCSHRTFDAWLLVPPTDQGWDEAMEYFSCWVVFQTAKMRENVFKTGTWPEFHEANPCKHIKSAHFWIDVNVDLSRFTSTVCLWWNFNTNTTKLQAFMFRASSTIFAKSVFRKTPCKRLGLNVSFMPFSSLFRPCDPNFEMRRSETHTSLFERTACQSNLESINTYQQFMKHFTRYTYVDTTNISTTTYNLLVSSTCPQDLKGWFSGTTETLTRLDIGAGRCAKPSAGEANLGILLLGSIGMIHVSLVPKI